MNDLLPSLLKQLCLPEIKSNWESLSKKAEDNHWTYSEYLKKLCEMEIASRYQKRIQRYIKESKLPAGKTLSTFDFASAKSINAAQIKAIAENDTWIEERQNIILFGPSGVGKTHLAAAIGHSLIDQGIRVFFSSATAMVQKLQIAKQEYKLHDMLNKLSKYQLLILDDIGYVRKNEMETSVLFELIADRYENNSIVITSNQPFSKWDSIFPDNVMTVAAVDRLVHHAIIINIEEKSYRAKEVKK